jgi:ComF family protein
MVYVQGISAIIPSLTRWLAPEVCVLCGSVCSRPANEPILDICEPCQAELPAVFRACRLCGEHLPDSAPSSMPGSASLCGQCMRRAPRFHATHCAYWYAYPIDHLVRALKYGNQLAYARVLGTLLALSLNKSGRHDWPDCIVPVPLAATRFCERGFNQAVEIAKFVSRHLAIPLATGALVRRRATREQAGLDKKARRRNLRGAFSLDAKLPKHVAVLDDVVTTGSTINEIARVLRRAGVQRIEVWAVARASK